eukprot:scaffold415_cov362-Prasinococcus_capsulatus_cf.AAC.2
MQRLRLRSDCRAWCEWYHKVPLKPQLKHEGPPRGAPPRGGTPPQRRLPAAACLDEQGARPAAWTTHLRIGDERDVGGGGW